MDMMSVKPRLPLDLDRSNRPGSEPKIVAGSHLKPLSGAAGISSPHHVPSAGRKFRTGPKVRNTVVAPLTLTLTPVGLTLIVCAITPGANRRAKQRIDAILRMSSFRIKPLDRKIADRKVGSGEWGRISLFPIPIPHSPFPTPHSPLPTPHFSVWRLAYSF